jgi:hypothetical protein
MFLLNCQATRSAFHETSVVSAKAGGAGLSCNKIMAAKALGHKIRVNTLFYMIR